MEAGAPGGGAALPARTKTLVLVAAILGTTVVTVDSTVVNVALPAIEDDLGGGLAGQQWTSNAYLVTLGSLLLDRRLAGRHLRRAAGVRARSGRLRRRPRSPCALAPTIELLVLARALQGVAGALLTPAALAVIVTTFPPERARQGGGRLDGLGRHRHGARAADRRPARRQRLVALDLRHQRADRDHHADPDPARRAGRTRARSGRARGLRGRRAVRPRPGRDDLRADRAAAARLDRPAGGAAASCSARCCSRASSRGRRARLSRCCRSASSGATTSPFGNIETFAMYGGLGLLFFFLVLFLQQVAGLQRARGRHRLAAGDAW